MVDRQKEVEVYDTPSNLGGTFTVSIVEEFEEIDETMVRVRVWYGRPTIDGWESWREWNGSMFTTTRDSLTKTRRMPLFSKRS